MESEPKNEFGVHAGGREKDVDAGFERELKQAFERRPAPPRLKRRVLEAVARQREATRRSRTMWWQRIAAGVLLAGVVSGGVMWRQAEERRKGEQARDQVMTALRITGRALHQVNEKLAARDRGE